MKKSEKILGLALLVILFLGANFILFIRITGKKQALDEQEIQISRERQVISDFLEMKDEMIQYEEWLDQHQPQFTTKAGAGKDILKLANSASEYNLEILSRVLLDQEEFPHAVQTSIVLKSRGTVKDTMKWLFHLQQPNQFRVIRQFKMMPEKDDKEIVNCNFTLMIWYRNESAIVSQD